jgi:hypothetical protein
MRDMKPALMAMIGLLALSLVVTLPADAGPVEAGTSDSGNPNQRQATPLATAFAQPDPLDGDPLDGDPLDGDPALQRPEPPQHVNQFAIQRSGRSKQASSSLPAYDDDPNTYWSPTADGQHSWVWLDLGTERRLRWLRVLSRGSGSIAVELSSDLREWQPEAEFEAGRGWHALELQNDARYVRLNLQGDAGNEAPAISEIDIYGTDSVALEQDASRKGRHKKHRAARGVVESQQATTTDESTDNSGKNNKNGGGNNGNIQVSAKKGKTDCNGKHARCQAKEGRVDVNTDCPGNGNCTINVQADGGTATCDTTAGDKNRSGSGEGKHNGNGGRCEAVANGGAVTIGDINP